MRELTSSAETLARNSNFTILVVEDDDSVRGVVVRILLRQGYQVLQAESSEQASTLAEMFYGPIHVLLTDVVMPGLSGPKLAERLKRTRTDLRVLFMSGHDTSYLAQHLQICKAPFIGKPFTATELAERLDKLLE